MNRRDFLKSLLAVGAGFTLPAIGSAQPLAATPALLDALDAPAVNAIWERGVYLFEVSDDDSISFADFAEPQTRAEAYSMDISDLDDIDALQKFAERTPLGNRLQDCYSFYRDELIYQMNEAPSPAMRRRIKKRLAKLPDDPDSGWMTWLEVEPRQARAESADAIAEFLNAPPDWGNEYEFLPDYANAQGAAYRYFDGQDQVLLETLGVVIIEGDCPGSSYFAAELRVSVEEANRAAQAADIPIRFKAG
jgi:hypothetical protein